MVRILIGPIALILLPLSCKSPQAKFQSITPKSQINEPLEDSAKDQHIAAVKNYSGPLAQFYKGCYKFGQIEDQVLVDAVKRSIGAASKSCEVFVERLAKVDTLDIPKRGITSLTLLGELSLKELRLANNHILSLAGLEKMVSLEALDLSGNKLENLEGLQKLKNLKLLNLGYNRLEEVQALSKLSKLEALGLAFNVLKSTAGLENLPRLVLLNLEGNGLRALGALRQNPITFVRVLGNPLPPETVSKYQNHAKFNLDKCELVGSNSVAFSQYNPCFRGKYEKKQP